MREYQQFFRDENQRLSREHRYRVFRQLERLPNEFPRVRWTDSSLGISREVIVWCSNDYLGMSQHSSVLQASAEALRQYGAGAGGTRNISGSHALLGELETELADLHHQDSALVFSSGYVANDTTLAVLGAALPGCIFFSDANNHASMIEGMRRSAAPRRIFEHNNPAALAASLEAVPRGTPKIVAFESLYSMDGDIAPLSELLEVANAYGALTFVDETHAVGVHGPRGGGLLEAAGLLDKVNIVQGGLGKGYGVVGGFISGNSEIVDFVRSHAPGFIFTTALPPAVVAGALASVRHLKRSQVERAALHRRVSMLRAALANLGLPLLPGRSQILPLIIGDAARCSAVAARLLTEFGVYLQAINYPTVRVGFERLRLTPTPRHDDVMQQALVTALAATITASSAQWPVRRTKSG